MWLTRLVTVTTLPPPILASTRFAACTLVRVVPVVPVVRWRLHDADTADPCASDVVDLLVRARGPCAGSRDQRHGRGCDRRCTAWSYRPGAASGFWQQLRVGHRRP